MMDPQPLLRAAETGDVSFLERMLDPHPLVRAAETGDVSFLERMLDPHPLVRAAETGDVSFLERMLAECKANNEVYSPISIPDQESPLGIRTQNILHVAAWHNQYEFLKVAIEGLPKTLVHSFLTQPSRHRSRNNPLHMAVEKDNVKMVNLILEFYKTNPNWSTPIPATELPWVSQNAEGDTPLHMALRIKNKNDGSALLILQMDYMDLVLKMVNKEGLSPLFLALSNGYEVIAMEILKSSGFYSSSGFLSYSFFHVVTRNPDLLKMAAKVGNGSLLKRTLDECKANNNEDYSLFSSIPDEEEYTLNILHVAVRHGRSIRFLEEAIEGLPVTLVHSFLTQSASHLDNNNPLHEAVKKNNARMVKLILGFYNKSKLSTKLPWLSRNANGDTPLHLALKTKNKIESCALEILEMDYVKQVFNIDTRSGESPLFLAVNNGHDAVTIGILKSSGSYSTRGFESYSFHDVVTRCPGLIQKAAKSGDVRFLKIMLDECNKANSYSWLSIPDEEHLSNKYTCNILHVAVRHNNDVFLKVAMKGLPVPLVHSFLTQPASHLNNNPLHEAVKMSNAHMVKLILGFYKKSKLSTATIITDAELPWVSKNANGDTPLHLALMTKYKSESCALEILGMDCMEQVLNMDTRSGESPLFLAVNNGYNAATLQILKYSGSYSTSGFESYSLHHLVTTCPGVISKAAELGDVRFLEIMLDERNKATSIEDYSWFSKPNEENGSKMWTWNIFHVAAMRNRYEFFKVAMKSLPVTMVHSFLTNSKSTSNLNPLQLAVMTGGVEIVKLILGFYKNNSKISDTPTTKLPWLYKHPNRATALHMVLETRYKEECALEILGMDYMDQVLNIDSKEGSSLLYYAINNGYNRVAIKIIVEYSGSYSTTGFEGNTPLHVIGGSSEEVLRLLLERHPDFIGEVNDDRQTILHTWINARKVWPIEYLRKWDGINLETKKKIIGCMYTSDAKGQNPFYIVADNKLFEASRSLAKLFNIWYRENEIMDIFPIPVVPWKLFDLKRVVDKHLKGNTSLGDSELHHLKSCILDGYYDTVFNDISDGSKDVEKVLDMFCELGWTPTKPREKKILRAALLHSVKMAENLVNKHSYTIGDLEDDEREKVLRTASESGSASLVEAILKYCPEALEKAPKTWIGACKKGHIGTVRAFFNNSPDFRDICYKIKDSPLHYIKLRGFEEYKEFLKDPLIWPMRNLTNDAGTTPLHTSIEDDNIVLAEALLDTSEVNRSIKDKKNKTSMDLLEDKCEKDTEWREMCERVGIVPGLKTTYFQDNANLLDVRSTLSVVAALLATITFTAAFTLPGGVQSDSNGKPILGNKASFLAFLIAATFAMCFSMLVLICLVWSMTADRTKSLLLIDSSTTMLRVALYNTIVAFMTGLCVVIPHKSLWVGILIIAMCSFLIILSIRTIIYKVLDLFYPAIRKKYKDEAQRLEEGQANQQDGLVLRQTMQFSTILRKISRLLKRSQA